MLIYGAKFEHNKQNSGALFQSMIGNFKSKIGTSPSDIHIRQITHAYVTILLDVVLGLCMLKLLHNSAGC